jgi:hypothetical protein
MGRGPAGGISIRLNQGTVGNAPGPPVAVLASIASQSFRAMDASERCNRAGGTLSVDDMLEQNNFATAPCMTSIGPGKANTACNADRYQGSPSFAFGRSFACRRSFAYGATW